MTNTKAGTYLPTPEGWKAELAWLFTCRDKYPTPGIEPGHGQPRIIPVLTGPDVYFVDRDQRATTARDHHSGATIRPTYTTPQLLPGLRPPLNSCANNDH